MGAANVKETFLTYTGTGYIWVIVLVAAVFLWLRAGRQMQKKMIWTAVIALLLIYNDAARKVIGKVVDVATYYRFLWLIPAVYIVAAAMAAWITDQKRKSHRVVVAVALAACLIFAGGNSYFSKDRLSLPGNEYNIPDEVIQVAGVIEQYKTNEQPVVMADLGILYTLRAYEPDILWACSRKAWMYVMQFPADTELENYKKSGTLIRVVQYGSQQDSTSFQKAIKKFDVDFIVVNETLGLDGYLVENGFEKVGAGGIYPVYQRLGS